MAMLSLCRLLLVAWSVECCKNHHDGVIIPHLAERRECEDPGCFPIRPCMLKNHMVNGRYVEVVKNVHMAGWCGGWTSR